MMESKPKLYHYFFACIVLFICGLIFFTNVWSLVATLEQRSGLNGSTYIYYQLSIIQFAIYNFIMAFLSSFVVYFILTAIFKADKNKMVKSLIRSLYFIALVIICEVYLNTRFVGKG